MGISFIHVAQDTSGTPAPQNQKMNWKHMHRPGTKEGQEAAMVAWVEHWYKIQTLMGISFIHVAQDTSGTPAPQNQKINWKRMHGNVRMNTHCASHSLIASKNSAFHKRMKGAQHFVAQ
jgi:hypothetical protein